MDTIPTRAADRTIIASYSCYAFAEPALLSRNRSRAARSSSSSSAFFFCQRYIPSGQARGQRYCEADLRSHGFACSINPVHFTASQKQAAPNGVCLTTCRIPLPIVPAGDGAFAVQLLNPPLSFAPGSALPAGGGAVGA